uniref:ZP domain-containing protein n=1 Tax=Heterorhabditis bacteriophora TaxID=37862 RepID=A0A1I7X5B3_HETBA
MAQLDDNELIGNPQIQCNSETIDMQFKTKKQFTGKVYVKGNFVRPECRVDYSKKTADGLPVGGIRLNHGACNMDRQRMLFVTKMDKAYNIKCMYREVTKTVTAHLDVRQVPNRVIWIFLHLVNMFMRFRFFAFAIVAMTAQSVS